MCDRGRRTGRRRVRKTCPLARNAQNLLRYHVQAGHIVRPAACEECGATGRRIEGAHFDYAEPLRVRWLCISCHRRWDKASPKGATFLVRADALTPADPPRPDRRTAAWKRVHGSALAQAARGGVITAITRTHL
jgi:hypothetical protein